MHADAPHPASSLPNPYHHHPSAAASASTALGTAAVAAAAAHYKCHSRTSPPRGANRPRSSGGGAGDGGNGGGGSGNGTSQFCDACNTACMFMNGRRRKFQARYEGYVLVKKVSTPEMSRSSSKSFLPYIMANGDATPQAKQDSYLLGKPHERYERRHSYSDILDESEVPQHHQQHQQQVPDAPAHSFPCVPLPLFGRSVSHCQGDWIQPYSPAEEQPKPCSPDGRPPAGPPPPPPQMPWGKMVNLTDAEVEHSGRASLKTSPPSGRSTPARGTEPEGYPGPRKPRRHSAMIEKLACGHQRLCRKKSRSQDNLSGGSGGSRKGSRGVEVLNNSIVLPPSTSLSSNLSRSEGSIHNVHALTVAGGIGAEDVSMTIGNLRVDEWARLPKRLLHRVTGEVGQLVFDLEGWREEYVVLSDVALVVRTPGGTQECLVPYSRMEDVHVVVPWGTSGHKYCVRIVVRDGSILLQASNSYIRDQWLHSILWKKNVYKYRNLLRAATRPDVVLKELKTLVELSLATPLHDHSVCQVPLELASSILTQGENRLSRQMSEEIIVTLAPLLENNQPSQEICNFFSRHCTDNPRSCLVLDMFTPVVTRILKHNVDFGKYPHVRRFVQDYIQALNTQNDGLRVVQQFIHNMHGPTSSCPHLRVLPNVVAVCTAAVCNLTELHKSSERLNNTNIDELSQHLNCYLSILAVICEYEDWRPGLAQLLQPIPFPDQALADENFIRQITAVVERIGTDPRCDVHQMVLGTREDKEGWLQILCPSSLACVDEGTAWANMLEVLINCCCKRKKFLRLLSKSLGACMLLALRGNTTAQDVLCLMLEWKQVDGADQSLQVVTTLQSTPTGKKRYQALCERQMHLRELQQKGGPRKLTLPSCSTDTDVIRLLSSGSFGNLEFLCLAFTRVTSACAEQLIKLPTLRYLNLWATQFGDVGLQLISEHLHKLQVLNLCETPVTDKGLGSLSSLKNLRKLNLNSTSLSAQTFEELKECLPALHECDVRYTDAW
ncbi:C-Maf-inducing protein-like isoform X2 [Oratosquilla oratoria]|uniref:C-Maf-inducing protein-like isoform X2 n=1 Tax=Oratosquilla oratoria TaxID=337810 RepID=UPI003F758BD5